MSIFVLGVDLGKTFCSLVGLDEEGAVVLRRTIRRSGLLKTIEKLEPKEEFTSHSPAQRLPRQGLGDAGWHRRAAHPEASKGFLLPGLPRAAPHG